MRSTIFRSAAQRSRLNRNCGVACGANCGVVGIGALVVVVIASGRSHLARTHPIEDGCDMGSDVDRRMEQDPVVVLGLFRNKKAQTGSTIHLARVSDLDRWCVRAHSMILVSCDSRDRGTYAAAERGNETNEFRKW